MTIWNAIAGGALELMLSPFAAWPLGGLAVISLLTAIGALLVIKLTAPHERIARVKRQILAGLFEIRLFTHDLRAIFRAQTEVLAANLRYVGLSLIPVLWMAIPLGLLLIQLESFFAYTGLEVGRPAIVKMKLRPGPADASGAVPSRPAATLTAADGVRVDGPPVWIPSLREFDWRVTPRRPGTYTLTVQTDGKTATKEIRAVTGLARYSPARVDAGFRQQLFNPAEPPLSADVPIASIEVGYPPRQLSILGWSVDWSVAYLALTMVFAALLKRLLE
jgi:hypothetical protein